MTKLQPKERKVLYKRRCKLERQERQLLLAKKTFSQTKIAFWRQKLEAGLPVGLEDTFRQAFEKGLAYVFQQATPLIEKSFDGAKLQDQFDTNRYRLTKSINSRNFRRLDRTSRQGLWLNKGLTAAEGGVLGFLGVGLPDIPIFLAVMCKTIYQICLSYGFSYHSLPEKTYILNLICAALTDGFQRQAYIQAADQLGAALDKQEAQGVQARDYRKSATPGLGQRSEQQVRQAIKAQFAGRLNPEISPDLLGLGEESQDFETREFIRLLSEASGQLASTVLIAKMLQSVALVGLVGGFTNYRLMSIIGEVVTLQYKKRLMSRNLLNCGKLNNH